MSEDRDLDGFEEWNSTQPRPTSVEEARLGSVREERRLSWQAATRRQRAEATQEMRVAVFGEDDHIQDRLTTPKALGDYLREFIKASKELERDEQRERDVKLAEVWEQWQLAAAIRGETGDAG